MDQKQEDTLEESLPWRLGRGIRLLQRGWGGQHHELKVKREKCPGLSKKEKKAADKCEESSFHGVVGPEERELDYTAGFPHLRLLPSTLWQVFSMYADKYIHAHVCAGETKKI